MNSKERPLLGGSYQHLQGCPQYWQGNEQRGRGGALSIEQTEYIHFSLGEIEVGISVRVRGSGDNFVEELGHRLVNQSVSTEQFGMQTAGLSRHPIGNYPNCWLVINYNFRFVSVCTLWLTYRSEA